VSSRTASAAAHALPTLRERKKLHTRDALAAAALRLAREHGFDGVTVDQIAASADVARRTFFRYFATKEAALFPDYARRLELFRVRLGEQPLEASPLARVEGAFLALAAVYMSERQAIVAQQRVVDAAPALIAYERMLDRDFEQVVAVALEPSGPERVRAGRRARILAGAIMGAVRATLREWFDADGRLDLVQLGRETFAQLASADEPTPPPAARRR